MNPEDLNFSNYFIEYHVELFAANDVSIFPNWCHDSKELYLWLLRYKQQFQTTRYDACTVEEVIQTCFNWQIDNF